MSNPLNKFIRKTGERTTTTVMDHSVMNRAVRTFNRMMSFRPEDTEGIRLVYRVVQRNFTLEVTIWLGYCDFKADLTL